ncbi:hypothetical protein [Nocardioides soli]|uniref:Uncharacterized protein n=1 Tax=Nocardioides soli TaxID=1036020 RepID=A0A7W4VT08_9ACTN|nr:hypothetical protein [Nocardioides soli]MBB3041231.1 hypothetical protein [Nocardioides soli]
MQGRRLPDTVLSELPVDYDDLQPGDYWKVMSRKDPAVPLTPDVLKHGTSPENGNLTNTVWGIVTPLGQYAMLSIHTVREHEDGTISIRPGDGSSNSVLVRGGPHGLSWHGYVDHGVWEPC